MAKQFPSYYRHDLLTWQRHNLELSMLQVANRTGLPYGTIRKVFAGRASNSKAWAVAKNLKLDWAMVHDLKLNEIDFHLAVTNGSKAG